MHTHKLYAGDLCRPHNLINGMEIFLLDETLKSVRGRAGCDDLLMVTAILPFTRFTLRAVSDLMFSLTGQRDPDMSGVQVLEVLVTTGPLAGHVRWVPSFWLAPVVRAPR